jgi:hypothetical protein
MYDEREMVPYGAVSQEICSSINSWLYIDHSYNFFSFLEALTVSLVNSKEKLQPILMIILSTSNHKTGRQGLQATAYGSRMARRRSFVEVTPSLIQRAAAGGGSLIKVPGFE